MNGNIALVGVGPAAAAVDPTTNRVDVANQISNTISVIDGSNSAISRCDQG